MKKKQLSKLQLNKITVASINQKNLNNINGGLFNTRFFCLKTPSETATSLNSCDIFCELKTFTTED